MKRILAIARLTFKAAVRFRLVWALGVLLAVAVLVMPWFLQDVGRAEDFIQLLLTYTLSAITGLLGLATLWLACGTLAKDVEECQIQMVVTKPVARWQIWVGKWIGIMSLNLLLLAVSGAAVYGVLMWRASKLPAPLQEKLRSEIFVARGSAREPDPNFEPAVDKIYAQRVKDPSVATLDREFVRKQIREQLKTQVQIVPPNAERVWRINLGLAKSMARDKSLFLRTKFTVTQKSENGTYPVGWFVGVPQSQRVWRDAKSMAAETFHQVQIPPNLFDDNGVLTIAILNGSDTDMLFQLEDGMELLYPEGSFTLNYARGLAVLLLWIGLLAAIGLAASSVLSFPVATFFSLGILMIVFSSGTITQILQEGTVGEVNHDTGVADKPSPIDVVALPVFRAMAAVINLAQQFSPVDYLSSGRSITWGQLGLAFAQIWLLLGGICALFGIITFTRRELATAQGTQ